MTKMVILVILSLVGLIIFIVGLGLILQITTPKTDDPKPGEPIGNSKPIEKLEITAGPGLIRIGSCGKYEILTQKQYDEFEKNGKMPEISITDIGCGTKGTAPLKLVKNGKIIQLEPQSIEYDGTNLYYTDKTGYRIKLSNIFKFKVENTLFGVDLPNGRLIYNIKDSALWQVSVRNQITGAKCTQTLNTLKYKDQILKDDPLIGYIINLVNNLNHDQHH